MRYTSLEYILKAYLGKEIILVFTVAQAGEVFHKISYRGRLKGRPCKRNFNDYDLFAVREIGGNAITYIDLRHWGSNPNYMVTFEAMNALEKTATPILSVIFSPY